MAEQANILVNNDELALFKEFLALPAQEAFVLIEAKPKGERLTDCIVEAPAAILFFSFGFNWAGFQKRGAQPID